MQSVAESKRSTISAVLIIKNEAAYIERALKSLLWCDEIVVVDSLSTDNTPRICQDPSAPWAQKIRFFELEWLGFSAQRNLANSKTVCDWIFTIDGDEACSAELRNKIQSIASDPESHRKGIQYKIRNQEYFLGRPIHYGIWNPSYHVRMYPRGALKFTGSVHEGIDSQCTQTIQIDEPIHHVENLQIERFLNKLNLYTTLQAKSDYESGMRTNFARILLSFPAMFYKNYIYYRSYRDGKEGFIISVLEGISRTVRHLKIWQMERLAEKTKETL